MSNDRANSVSHEQFVAAIINANGQKTNAEIAKQLGMKLSSFSTRYSNVTTELSQENPPITLPPLKRRVGAGRPKSKMSPEAIRELLAKMNETSVASPTE